MADWFDLATRFVAAFERYTEAYVRDVERRGDLNWQTLVSRSAAMQADNTQSLNSDYIDRVSAVMTKAATYRG